MTAIKSMYEEMDDKHQILMDDNQEHLKNMLDYAIHELVNIARENEIYLVDDLYICETYEEIFDCLKHWSEKRKSYMK